MRDILGRDTRDRRLRVGGQRKLAHIVNDRRRSDLSAVVEMTLCRRRNTQS